MTFTTGDLVSAADLNDFSVTSVTVSNGLRSGLASAVNESDAPSTYPLGISTALSTGTGWPENNSGFVTTVKHSAARVMQFYQPADASLGDVPTFVRQGYEVGGTDGWSDWAQSGGNRNASGVQSVTHTSQQDKTTSVSFPNSALFASTTGLAVVATVQSGVANTVGMTCRVSSVSTSGFDLLTRATASITETFNVSWIAMQEPTS